MAVVRSKCLCKATSTQKQVNAQGTAKPSMVSGVPLTTKERSSQHPSATRGHCTGSACEDGRRKYPPDLEDKASGHQVLKKPTCRSNQRQNSEKNLTRKHSPATSLPSIAQHRPALNKRWSLQANGPQEDWR